MKRFFKFLGCFMLIVNIIALVDYLTMGLAHGNFNFFEFSSGYKSFFAIMYFFSLLVSIGISYSLTEQDIKNSFKGKNE